MTFTIRTMTFLLAGLLAATGTAAAQGSALHGDWRLDHDGDALGGEAGVFEEGQYADLDAGVITENASAALDTDVSASDAEDAAEGDFWTWLELRFSAVVDALRDLSGLEAPAEADANADLYASADGVDVDANAGDLVFDESPVGELDGMTYQAAASAQAGASGVVPS